jgi:hypothetical protein
MAKVDPFEPKDVEVELENPASPPAALRVVLELLFMGDKLLRKLCDHADKKVIDRTYTSNAPRP